MRLDIARTQIKALFEDILETRHVEKGDFVEKGDQIATVVDLNPLFAVGFVNMTQKSIKPAKFDNHDGFRLDFTFATQDGLNMSGIVRGAVVNEKLHLGVFSAPTLYFFQREQIRVEAILGSISFAKKAAA
ncbi:MAG: hypothetical protein VW547_10105 [Alphaproteobacteria bacterium]